MKNSAHASKQASIQAGISAWVLLMVCSAWQAYLQADANARSRPSASNTQ